MTKAKTGCKCIDELKKKVTEMSGDPSPSAPFESSLLSNFKEGTLKHVYIGNITHRKKKRDGSLTVKKYKCPVTFNFCPFCGKKYEDKK